MRQTLIIILYISDLLLVKGTYFTEGKFPCHNSIFVYPFCRLLDFSQKLNMAFYDCYNIQSGNNVIVELFKYGLFTKIIKEFSFPLQPVQNADNLR